MKDIRKKNEKELREELGEQRAALRQFRFGMAGGRSRDAKAGRNIRKTIARMLTELHARELKGNT